MMPNSKQTGISSKLRSTSRRTTKQTENQRTVIEQLEWLWSIKANKKSLEKQEKEALAELDRMLAAGEMDDARDCGEDRWQITGMTLTRVKKMGSWIHSPEPSLRSTKSNLRTSKVAQQLESHPPSIGQPSS